MLEGAGERSVGKQRLKARPADAVDAPGSRTALAESSARTAPGSGASARRRVQLGLKQRRGGLDTARRSRDPGLPEPAAR